MNIKIYLKTILSLGLVVFLAPIYCSAPTKTLTTGVFRLEKLTLNQARLALDNEKRTLALFMINEAHQYLINWQEKLRADIRQADVNLKYLYNNCPFPANEINRLQNILHNEIIDNQKDNVALKKLEKYMQDEHTISTKKLSAQLELNSMSNTACDALITYNKLIKNIIMLETQVFKLSYKDLVSQDVFNKILGDANLIAHNTPLWKEWEELQDNKGDLLMKFDAAAHEHSQIYYLYCSIALEREYLSNEILRSEKNFWQQKYNEKALHKSVSAPAGECEKSEEHPAKRPKSE